MPTYPGSLAGSNLSEGTFDPFELYAGDVPVTTDHGTASGSITQFQVVARNEDGNIVPYNELTGTASKAGTFTSTGVDGDLITINGQAITLKTSASTTFQSTIAADAAHSAAPVAALINAHPDTFNVRAVAAGAVLTIYALFPGAGGNSIAIAKTFTTAGDFAWAGSATALSGGSDETESKAIGIAAQAASDGQTFPYFTGGCFNHAVLGWPAELTTLVQRKAVFDRTRISIDTPKGVSSNMVIPA